MNNLNSKVNKSNKFIYQFTANKNMALANIKSEYNNNKFKISAPTWNDIFDLPDGSYSVSDIQNYFEYIIKEHETIADIYSAIIYVNEIKNRTIFKIKTGYKLE